MLGGGGGESVLAAGVKQDEKKLFKRFALSWVEVAVVLFRCRSKGILVLGSVALTRNPWVQIASFEVRSSK